jgi:hypothetical protein
MDISQPWNLALYNPLFFVLGLVILLLLTAFIYACAKI